ncbi:MAG: sigma-70 family RNA polymerase sigma factor, partial [Candidatus Omnitrophota bacterium]
MRINFRKHILFLALFTYLINGKVFSNDNLQGKVVPAIALRPIAGILFNEAALKNLTPCLDIENVPEDIRKAYFDQVRERIVNWYHTGEGLRVGDYIILKINLGLNKYFQHNGKKVSFKFNMRGKLNQWEDVILVVENDLNHGLVVNWYYLKDYNRGEVNKPFATFKYHSNIQRPERINLAAFDIVGVHYNLKQIYSLSRKYESKIDKNGHVYIGIPKNTEYNLRETPLLKVPADRFNEELIGKKVVVMVQDDKNHGQVINIYLADERENNKNKRPLATYKYFKQAGKDVLIDLSLLDLLNARVGKELSIFGRPTISKIHMTKFGSGICEIWFPESIGFKRIPIVIPKDRMNAAWVGLNAVIVVEKDANQGQVINVYLEKEFSDLKNRRPVTTYKYDANAERRTKTGVKKGMLKLVDLAQLDISDYYKGNRNIEPREGAEVDVSIVRKEKKADGVVVHTYYQAEKSLGEAKNKKFILGLYPYLRQEFSAQQMPQPAKAKICKDPNYGAYVEVFNDKKILSNNYYIDEFSKCMTCDFQTMAFQNYVLCNKNVYGKDIIPQRWQSTTRVNNTGGLILRYRGRRLDIYGLLSLIGEKPIFVPVADDVHGYKFYVYKDESCIINKDYKPVVFLRNNYFKTLVPIERADYFFAKELAETGLCGISKNLLEDIRSREIFIRGPKKLLDEVLQKHKEMLCLLQSPDSIQPSNKFKFYLSAFADAICTGNVHAEHAASAYFKGLMKDAAQAKGLIKSLLEEMDFKSEYYSQAHFNTAAIWILKELPSEYKNNLELARKVSQALDYNGHYKQALQDAVKAYFRSISNEYVYKPRKDWVEKALKSKKGQSESVSSLERFMHEILEYRLLTALGEVKLGVLKELNDSQAKIDFTNANYTYVIDLAKKYQWSGFELIELIQEGYFGLTKAVEEYKAQTGNRFSTYANYWIRQAIWQAIYAKKDQVRLPVSQVNKLSALRKACVKANLDLYDKKVDTLDISQKTGFDIDEVDNIRNIIYTMQSFEGPLTEDDDEFSVGHIIGAKDEEYDVFEKKEVFLKIAEQTTMALLRIKDEEDAMKAIGILKLRLIPLLIKEDAATLEVTGEQYNLSGERIRQIEPRVTQTLKDIIKNLNLTIEDLYLRIGIPNLHEEIDAMIDSIVEKAITQETAPITPTQKTTAAISESALRPEASKSLNKILNEHIPAPSRMDVRKRIVKWHYTGEGLNEGDSYVTVLTCGKVKNLRHGNMAISFSSGLIGPEGKKIKVIFIYENDLNHGWVLNCYSLKDYQSGRTARPLITHKYFPEIKKSAKVNLALSDIISTLYGLQHIYSLARPFNTKISDFATVPLTNPERTRRAYPLNVALIIPKKIFKEKKLAGTEVVVLVEDDKNHGQVISVYTAKDYKKGNFSDPVATYKNYPDLEFHRAKRTGRVRATFIKIGVLDVIRAQEGQNLKTVNRFAVSRIKKGNCGVGACGIDFLEHTRYQKRIAFTIPRERIKEGMFAKFAVIIVENDINHGQVINIYLESDFKKYNKSKSRQKPKPLVTYKYIPEISKCTIVDLAALDISDYINGRQGIRLAGGRVLEIPVIRYFDSKREKFGYRAVKSMALPAERKIDFALPGSSEALFFGNKVLRVKARLLKDPDYGLYCVLKRQNVALNTYYYHRDRKICMSTDLPRMRFIDFVLGENNIYDEPIIPQEYKCPVTVSGRGQLMLTHKNKRIGIYLLQALAGKRPVFVPVVDEEYGYKIYVHDSDKYEYDKARKPDIVLVRNGYFKTLIPIDKVELYLKKEMLDKKFTSAEEMMLAKINELTRLSKQSPDSCIKEALKDLDFKSLYYTQPYINTAILTALLKLPAEYKNNLELARKISHALDYKGRYKKPLHDAVRQYFSSIPDEYVFQPLKKHSSKTQTFNDDEDDEEEEPLLLLDRFKKDISKYRQLTALGEVKLGVLKELGEDEAKEDFINSNYGLLVSVARNYEWSGFSILDLVQDGYFGLLRAIEKYKPQKEYKFSTYATPWIKAVIMRAIYAKKNQ